MSEPDPSNPAPPWFPPPPYSTEISLPALAHEIAEANPYGALLSARKILDLKSNSLTKLTWEEQELRNRIRTNEFMERMHALRDTTSTEKSEHDDPDTRASTPRPQHPVPPFWPSPPYEDSLKSFAHQVSEACPLFVIVGAKMQLRHRHRQRTPAEDALCEKICDNESLNGWEKWQILEARRRGIPVPEEVHGTWHMDAEFFAVSGGVMSSWILVQMLIFTTFSYQLSKFSHFVPLSNILALYLRRSRSCSSYNQSPP
ncbi:hypothetical protein NA57DRAFT_59706 [Rhizodiscina lignyota]|uniref:Uncharacterized protein n=1 Tax=Rhizodiscina lignyota TaxID=1504668 RepID=A0A9P4M2I7_9PEZI|nr:hypothetical protein NA57DRAFT_59706 [Rhizodiscina lignyota]